MKSTWTCRTCNVVFLTRKALIQHCKNHPHVCEYCNQEFISGQKLGAHKPHCTSHPRYHEFIETKRQLKIGIPCSEATKIKIRQSVNQKIVTKTWHNSFARSRTHAYNNVNFHGTWELKYATWLDNNQIEWSRPTEIFPYEWEGKIRNYTPDFYLVSEDCYVEIKGYETDRDRAKWSHFPKRLKILKGKDLKELNLITSFKNI